MTAPNHSRAFVHGHKAQTDMTAASQRNQNRPSDRPRNQIARRLDALFPLSQDELPPAFQKVLREIARRLD